MEMADPVQVEVVSTTKSGTRRQSTFFVTEPVGDGKEVDSQVAAYMTQYGLNESSTVKVTEIRKILKDLKTEHRTRVRYGRVALALITALVVIVLCNVGLTAAIVYLIQPLNTFANVLTASDGDTVMTGNMVPTFSPHDTTRRRLRMLSNGNAVVTVGQINATDCERAYQAATQGKITSATVAVSPTTSDGVAYRADGSINYVSGRMMRRSSHTEGAVFDIRTDPLPDGRTLDLFGTYRGPGQSCLVTESIRLATEVIAGERRIRRLRELSPAYDPVNHKVHDRRHLKTLVTAPVSSGRRLSFLDAERLSHKDERSFSEKILGSEWCVAYHCFEGDEDCDDPSPPEACLAFGHDGKCHQPLCRWHTMPLPESEDRTMPLKHGISALLSDNPRDGHHSRSLHFIDADNENCMTTEHASERWGSSRCYRSHCRSIRNEEDCKDHSHNTRETDNCGHPNGVEPRFTFNSPLNQYDGYRDDDQYNCWRGKVYCYWNDGPYSGGGYCTPKNPDDRGCFEAATRVCRAVDPPMFGPDTATAAIALEQCNEAAPTPHSSALVAELVPMDQLSANDYVLDLDRRTRTPRFTRVTYVDRSRHGHDIVKMLTIRYAGGSITLTGNHLMRVNGRVVRADRIEVGDVLEAPSGAHLMVESVAGSDGRAVNPYTVSLALLSWEAVYDGTNVSSTPVHATTIAGIHWSRMDEMLFDPNGSQLVHIGILPMLLPGFLAPQQHQKYSEYVFGRIEEYANKWREGHGGSYFLDWPHPWAMFLLFFMVFELGFVGLLTWQAVITASAMMGALYLASGYVLRTEVAGKSQRKA